MVHFAQRRGLGVSSRRSLIAAAPEDARADLRRSISDEPRFAMFCHA